MRRRRLIPIVAALALSLPLGACQSKQDATGTPSPTVAPTAANTIMPTDTPVPTDTPAPSDTIVPSGFAALDGLPADNSVANRLPLAVMIGDNAAARPQSGFNAASIVYQAPADGGEDRYMLVFQEKDASDVGPVRSGRPYFVYWAAEYRSGFAHYGGDERTLQKVIPPIAGSLIYNLDALFGSGSAFHRIKSRKAPDNAYTSTASLTATAARNRYPATMVTGLPTRLFGDDAPLASRPASGSITIPYGTGSTSYAYDRATNSYLRSVAGRAQIDSMDGKRVVARDVVVLFMRLSIDPQSEVGHHRPVLDQIGSGTAWVFRDGQVIKGTWRKKDQGDLTRFFDSTGAEISLVRGRIFIQVVPTGTKVSYKAAG